MVIGHYATKFGFSLKFLIYCLRDLTVGVFFRNILVSKISIYVNFYPDPHFQGHLLQELDGQT